MAILIIEGSQTHTATGAGAAADASAARPNWTLTTRIEALSPDGAAAQVLIQESLDGFAADIRTLAIADAVGHPGGFGPVTTITQRERPTARIGAAGCQLRVYLQTLDAGATVTVSAQLA
jgi:hypothetical protein